MILQIKTFNLKKGYYGNYVLEIKSRGVVKTWYAQGYERANNCKKDIDFSITVDEKTCKAILKEHNLIGIL